ncbi:MAG: amino acid ABC transporter substrate-binding protein [Quinella sp. 2Q5]|nr:amino acid ABC transporter substrate-binding protein [Quinella sp. 2Q5]
MKKIFLLLMIALFVTGCVASGKTPKLVVGVDDEFAPMAFRDEQGKLVGFDIDLAKEVARRMGVDIEFKPILWDNKREEITSGNVDIIWNGLDITDESRDYMIFSKPYMDNRQILLVKHGNPLGIHSDSEIAGKVVGTQAGSNSAEYINATPSLKDSFAGFKTYRSVKTAFEDLSLGGVDVLIVDEIAARYEIAAHPGKFEAVEATIGPVTKIGIGFRKDDTELRDRVQKVFDDMVEDGTAKKISEHWFQADLIKLKR